MAVIKCKMCGGDVVLAEDKTFGTCEYCGCTMTFPRVSDEQRAAAFNRGNHFRRIGEFDKALSVYERIVSEDDADAEAHWCCALCRFGIEYVEDPVTMEWLPTCHRMSFDSFLKDPDYLAAVERSEGITRRQYQKDAAKIAEVQRGILATSQSAEPYDVFLSYKELDAEGKRTRDSILAQEIYYQLAEKGWRVFFSRISLEDVPGTQYEPYIFAALNSAKVMVVVGTSAENLNAVWVKNEWSRYLSLMRRDRSKLLIPCYRDMDPYELPEQLSVLMSYDMGKIGFIQDLIRGVDKVLKASKPKAAAPVQEKVVVQQSGGPNIAPLLKRAFLYLEDGEWQSADEYCEKVLDQDPENPRAYLGKLLSGLRKKRLQELSLEPAPFDANPNYQKALRFVEKRPEYAEEIQTLRQLNDRILTSQRLYQALTKDDPAAVKECMKADFDPNYVYKDQNMEIPLLSNVICRKNPDMVRLLLDKGANPNCERVFQDGRRFSALRDSITQWPNDEIAGMLVAAGADVNYIETNNGFQVPMLINAIYKKNAGMVKLLLDKGATPNCERLFQGGRRFSALRDSIVEWPDDEIAKMLVAAGADVNYIETNNGFQVPMLINAIYQKNPGMVRLLLDKGADPNCERLFQDGRRFSALRDSIIQWPNNEIARMLIAAGADVNYIDTSDGVKVPVLISAICEKNPGMVRLLLDKGADPNCERLFQDGRRFSALRDSIIQWPNNEIAWMLINAGADVNYIDTNDGVKVPVLISAICEKNAGVVKLLLDKGANPNCERVFQNGHRYSALRDSIAEWPSDEIAKMLIASGADVNYIDIGDKVKIPVLIHAIRNKKPGLVKLLLEKGANPNCERVLEGGQHTSALRDSILQWPNEEIARMLVDAGARFEKDDQLRRAKLENTHFSKETFRRFRAAGWRPPLF